MAISAAIYGSSGPTLTPAERAFFRETRPFGLILFARNIVDPQQVRALCAEMREAAGHDAPILIDQEGGAVCNACARRTGQPIPLGGPTPTPPSPARSNARRRDSGPG